jgi:hypothetical protein
MRLTASGIATKQHRSSEFATVRLSWRGSQSRRITTRLQFPLLIPNRNDVRFGMSYFLTAYSALMRRQGAFILRKSGSLPMQR